MSSSRSPWLWQLHSTTALVRGRKRWRCSRTLPHGDRTHHIRGRGPASSRIPGHSGATVACVAPHWTHPTLGLPLLAGASGEVVDASAPAFLTRAVLEEKRKDEVEKAAKVKVKEEQSKRQRRQALRQELVALLDPPVRSAQLESRINAILEILWGDAEAAAASSSSQPGRRKGKKKRRRRTRRTSARLWTCSGSLFSCSS